MLRAVVLAAGESRRMGEPKAALALGPGGPTFAASVVATLQACGLSPITVVAGAHPAAVRQALDGVAEAVVVEHPGWTAGQLSSLLAGLAAVEGPDLDGLLVTLVDCPAVRPDTVARLIEAWRASGAAIVRPAIGARHGHPVIFDRRTFEHLRQAPPDRGAKAVIAHWQAEIVNLVVDDPGVLADIDTPDDYATLVRSRR